jgi:general stress protein 26
MSDHPEHPHQKVHTFLRHHPMGILSTVSEDGKPWGAAIYYVVDEDFNFYFVTRAGTHKYQNLESHPFVALTVADSGSQTTVQLSGKVEKLPVKDYMDIVFDKLTKIKPADDHSWTPPLAKIHEGNYMPLKLTPDHLQYANYGHRREDPGANYIEKII